MAKSSSFDPLDNLHSLSELEWKVLKEFCEGLTQKQIADVLDYEYQSVRDSMARIYLKLWLNIHEVTMRRKIIYQDVCPAIHEMETKPEPPEIEKDVIEVSVTTKDTDGDQYEIQQELTEHIDETDEEIEIPPDVYKMIDEDEKALIPIKSDLPIKLVPPPNGSDGSNGCGSPLLWGLIVLLTIALLISIVRPPFLFPPDDVNSQSQQPGAADEQEIPYQEEPQLPSNTPEPPQPTDTAHVVTPTIPPATNTPEEPAFTPPEDVYTDDFSDGADPGWEVIYGNLGMASGVFTVRAPFTGEETQHLAILEPHEWEDLKIAFTLAPLKYTRAFTGFTYFSYLGVILKYVPNGESLGVLFSRTEIVVGYLDQSGEWSTIPATSVNPEEKNVNLGTQSHEIIIELVDEILNVWINNQNMTFTQITGYDIGKMGLWFQTNMRSDTVEEYAPRIERLSIESLP